MTGRKSPAKERSDKEKPNNSAKDVQAKVPSATVQIPKWLFYCSSLIACLAAILLSGYYALHHVKKWELPDQGALDEREHALFTSADANRDGFISPAEFAAIVQQFLPENISNPVYTSIDDDDEVITIFTQFIPLQLDTMTKEKGSFFGSTDTLHGLRNWKIPSTDWYNFGASHFKGFLPHDATASDLENVGHAYWIFQPTTNWYGSPTLPSNRYYPPPVEGPSNIIHRLLSLFHPRPFIWSRFIPQGAVATVRAYNEEFVEITFRIHAEFQLNEPPYHPLWFTPGQFAGSLIMTRNATRVIHFKMAVPNDKKLNVDLEWLNGPVEDENMEVDIGYMPLMVLNNTSPSMKIPEDESFYREVDHPHDPQLAAMVASIRWTKQISQQAVVRALEVKMYKFKEVPYYNFTSVFQKADAERKLVHSILLWGALDDQSC